jgi:hypothetical protein
MKTKFTVIALAAVGFGFALAPRANAGTEVVEPQYAPRQTYNYAPPQPVVYYAPPPVRVVVYPTIGYYGPRYHFYGYERRYRHGYHRSHHWR